MANRNTDILATLGIDTSQALRQVNDFAKGIKPINIKFNGQPLGTISRDVNAFRDSLRAAELRTVAFASAAGQLFAVQRAFQAITKATLETEKSLTDINVVLGLSQRQLVQFSNGLFKVANETGTSFKVAAEGATELSRQGLSATETLKRLKDALTLTRLSGLDVEKSVNAITAAINSFNDATLDSTAIINKLANVDAQFAVSSGDLAEALSRVGSTAKDVGVNLDELIGFVTAAKQITQRDGSVIGNSLKTIFQRIQRPEVLENLRELGVLTQDLSGKTLGAQQILVNLAQTYGRLSEAQKNQVIQLSAGVYQANQFRAILSDLSKENSIYTRAVQASSTASDQAARRQVELNKTLAASVNETINNLTRVSAKVGDLTLKPLFERVLGIIDSGINGLSDRVGETGGSVGATVGEGILRGIGNYLAGPGLILGGSLILKLVSSFAGTATRSLANILESNNSRVRQEEAIRNLLAQQPTLMNEIAALGSNHAKIQERIGSAITQNNAKLNEQLRVMAQIRGQTGNIGIGAAPRPFVVQGGNLKRAAVGIIPAAQETIGALNAGYRPGKIKQLSIPKLGNVVYNDAERVKYFPGFSQPAIIPPLQSKAGQNYKKTFIQSHGFNPYANERFVPNYMPSISKAQAAELLKSRNFQSLTYSKSNGETAEYNSAQYRVRRDKLVGADAPAGYDNWTDFDTKTNSLVLHSTKSGETEAKFRRFKLDGIKQIRAKGEIYDIMNKGFIPNYNFSIPNVELSKSIGAGTFKTVFDIKSIGNKLDPSKLVGIGPKRIEGFDDIKKLQALNDMNIPFVPKYHGLGRITSAMPKGLSSSLVGIAEKVNVLDDEEYLNIFKNGGVHIGDEKQYFDIKQRFATAIAKSIYGKFGIQSLQAFEKGNKLPILGDFRARNLGYRDKDVPDQLSQSLLMSKMIGSTEPFKDKLGKLLESGKFTIIDTGELELPKNKIPVKFGSKGHIPNFSSLNLDNYFKELIENEKGFLSYTIDKQRNQANINSIGARMGYRGAGVGDSLYPVLFDKLKRQGIGSVTGAIVNQGREPRSNNPVDRLKALFPQLSRGRYGSGNRLVNPEDDSLIHLLGGQDFDMDLKRKAPFIFKDARFASSLDFTSFLSKGLVPNFAGFRTSHGSKYILNELGQTSRTKLSVGRGQGETSPHYPVAYVSETASHQILEAMQSGGRLKMFEIGNKGYTPIRPDSSTSFAGKKIGIGVLDRKTGQFIVGGPAYTEPKIGRVPIEMSYHGDEKTYHIGHPISELFSQGLIPNFNALSSAISRENKAGIPLSQIRVGQSSLIKSSFNPLGLGVYNTKDEPLGLNQGIQRVAAMGLDPKKAGVPNFAAPLEFKDSLISQKTKDLASRDFAEIQTKLKTGVITLAEALDNFKQLNKITELTPKSFNNLNQSLKQLGANFEQNRPGTLKSAIDTATQRYPEAKSIVRYGSENLTRLSPTAAARLREGSIDINKTVSQKLIGGNFPNFIINPSNKGNLGKQIPFDYKAFKLLVEKTNSTLNAIPLPPANFNDSDAQRKLRQYQIAEIKARKVAQEKGISNPEEIKKYQQDFLRDLTDNVKERGQTVEEKEKDKLRIQEENRRKISSRVETFGSSNRLESFSEIKSLRKEIRDSKDITDEERNILRERLKSVTKSRAEFRFARAAEDAFKNIGFLDAVNPLNFLGGNTKFNRAQRKYGDTQSAATFRNNFQNKALLASFALPGIAGVAEQGLLNNFGDSTTGRGFARAAGSLGNVGASILTGATIGGPVGVGIAALGILPEIPSVIKAFTDTLPDLKRELEKVTESSQKTSNAIGGAISAQEGINDFKGNVGQFEKINGLRQSALSQINDTKLRGYIGDLLSGGNLGQAREAQVAVDNNNEVNKKFIETRALFTQKDTDSKLSNVESKFNDINRELVLAKNKSTLNEEARSFAQKRGLSYNNNDTSFNDIYFLQKQQKKTIEDYLSNTSSGQSIRQLTGNVLNIQDPFNKYKISDVLRNNDITKGQTDIAGIAKRANEVFRYDLDNSQLDSSTKSGISNFLDILNDLARTPKDIKSVAAFQLLTGKEGLSSEGFNERDRLQKDISAKSYQNAQALRNLNEQLFKFSEQISKIDFAVENSGIKSLSKLNRRLGLSEVNFSRDKNISLINNPDNQYLAASLNKQGDILGIRNQAQKQLTEIDLEFGKSISSLITDTQKSLVKSLSEEAASKGKGSSERAILDKKLEQYKSVFENDKEINDIVKIASSGNISDSDINKIKSYFENQIKGLEEFDGAYEQIVTFFSEYEKANAKSGGKLNKSDFIKQFSQNSQFALTQTGKDFFLQQNNAESAVSQYNANQAKVDFYKSFFGVPDLINQRQLSRNRVTTSSRDQIFLRNRASDAEIAEIKARDAKQISDANNTSNLNRLKNRRGLAFDIARIGANPFQTNQLNASQNIEAYNEDRFNELRNKGIGVNNLSDLRSRKSSLSNKSLNSQELGELSEINKALNDIENNEAEINEKKEAANELDRIALQFAERRLQVTRDVNRGLASKGQGGDINLLSTLIEPLQQTPADFWGQMSDNLQSFGVDFKDAFKNGFADAIKNGESLTESLRKSFLNFASDIAVKNANLALDSIFGSVYDGLAKATGTKSQTGGSSILTDLLGSVFSSKKSSGGVIGRFANGGFVNMGSGLRDDVPALLSGGEYVIKKSSVNKIGKPVLDKINGYASGGSFNQTLKNEYLTLGDINRPNSGRFNIDPNLSSIALTDENNPQNALKFSRENYMFEKAQYDAQNRRALKKYESSQKQNAYIAFGSALFNAGLQGYSQYSQSQGLKKAQYGLSAADAGIEISKSDVAAINKLTSQGYGLNAIRAGNLQGSTKYNYNLYQANGGLIRGFANGGIFGAESPMDKYPAMLMGGEYVVKKPVVDSLGVGFFDSLNRTGRPPKGFVNGGVVGGGIGGLSVSESDSSKYLSELISISQEMRDLLSNKSTNNVAGVDKAINIAINTNISIGNDGVESESSAVNTNNTNNDKNSISQEDAKRLNDSINNQIKQTLIKESSNGGILYEIFKKRG